MNTGIITQMGYDIPLHDIAKIMLKRLSQTRHASEVLKSINTYMKKLEDESGQGKKTGPHIIKVLSNARQEVSLNPRIDKFAPRLDAIISGRNYALRGHAAIIVNQPKSVIMLQMEKHRNGDLRLLDLLGLPEDFDRPMQITEYDMDSGNVYYREIEGEPLKSGDWPYTWRDAEKEYFGIVKNRQTTAATEG